MTYWEHILEVFDPDTITGKLNIIIVLLLGGWILNKAVLGWHIYETAKGFIQFWKRDWDMFGL